MRKMNADHRSTFGFPLRLRDRDRWLRQPPEDEEEEEEEDEDDDSEEDDDEDETTDDGYSE